MAVPFDQVVSLFGAFLILTAFAASTLGRLKNTSLVYHTLNLLGATGLTYTAVMGHQTGFIVLEGTWTAVSAIGIVRAASRILSQPRGGEEPRGG